MHPRLSWIARDGKQILLQDYVGLSPDEAIEVIHEVENFLAEDNKMNLRSLLDLKGLYARSDLVAVFRESAKMNRHRYNKLAIIGLDGVKLMILKTIKQFTSLAATPFKSKEEALDWLGKD